MVTSRKLHALLSLFLALLLSACGTFEIYIETPEPTAQRRETRVALAPPPSATAEQETASPSPTATQKATATATPSATATETSPPTATTAPAVASTATSAPPPTPALRVVTATPSPTPEPQAQILAFTASPTELAPGGTISVTWQAIGEEAQLCLQVASITGIATRDCEDVPLQETRDYELDPMFRNRVDLALRVQAGDAEVTETIPILLPCPPDWWFLDNPPDVCPADEPLQSAGVAQYFERGMMIYVQTLGAYYILFDESPQPYQDVYDPLPLSEEEVEPPGTPPDGLYAPISGFGLLWRGEVQGVEPLKERLGWALGLEFGFPAVQQSEAQLRFPRTFLQGPDGLLIVLEPSFKQWSLWEE